MPDAKIEYVHLIHSSNLMCPAYALIGKKKIHAHNGIYMAKVNEEYLACCTFCNGMGYNKSTGLVAPVPGMEKSFAPWAIYTGLFLPV